MNVLSLFDGMSCGQLALRQADIPYDNYYASEIDKYAIKIAQKNYPDTVQIGDICEFDKVVGLPKIDLLFGGSPCQSFSNAGERSGFNGKSKLFWEFIKVLKATNPEHFLLENVRMKPQWENIITKEMGVEPVLINSDLFVPQNRPRLYWTNIPIAPLPNRPAWDGKYFQYRRTYFRENKSGVCPCLTANMGTGGHNVPLHSADVKDKLSPVECERLQGVPDNYTDGVSNSQRYKMIGNGWTVNVISHIFQGLK
jgi:site-specific DNA-cytosine methylase